MYIASLDELSYDIYSVGATKDECRYNMVTGFVNYVTNYGCTVDQWVEKCDEDFNNYDNDVWTFLNEYYGVHMFNITKGYAIGWE